MIVPSFDPDTILVPSGENVTDLIQSLWAFVFSLNRPIVTARQASRRQFWPRRGDLTGLRRTKIPDFDRPVVRSGHDLGPVRGKHYRRDPAAVGVRLLRHTVDEHRDHPANKRRVYSAAHGDLGPKRGSKLEGRLTGLDADMQQPATCRKVEVDLVRRVAPKLIANGESHALERGRPARGLRLGSHVAVKRAGMEGKEAYSTVVGGGARLRMCGKARGKITVVRETKGHACLLPECQRGAP